MGERVRRAVNGTALHDAANVVSIGTMRIQDWKGESGDAGWWVRTLSFAVVAGIVFGVFGPFGSFLNGDVVLRIFSWTGNLVGGTLIVGLLLPPITRFAIRLGLPMLAGLAIAILVTAALGSVFAALYGHWLWPYAITRVRPVDWFSQSLLVELCLLGLWIVIDLARQALTKSPPPKPVEPAVNLKEPVLCLQMEDHYVRIHRASGSTLELMPLHEAIGRYGSPDGLQVHRSWWVAGNAVAEADRDVRNWRLRLSNGLFVPVARNRIVDVRARGWIGDDKVVG